MNLTPLEQLTYTNFADVVKTRFRVWVNAQNSLEMELSKVTPPRLNPTGGASSLTYENFTLLFSGPMEPLLPQHIYCFESSVLGRFELYIVPAGQDASGTQYQATFNRVVKTV